MSTEKKIVDYLPYYVGCDCKHVSLVSDIFQLTAVQSDSDQVVIRNHKDRRKGQYTSASNIKPLLSKLEDMTEEGGRDICNILCKTETCYNNPLWLKSRLQKDLPPALFHYLLKKGYWLFGNDWFDEGLIIDRKTLK